LTVITTVAVSVQPIPFVPTTEYVIVADGAATRDEPELFPGSQVKLVAPLAVSVEEPPEQIEFCEAETVTAGAGVTLIATVFVAVQPFTSVPVTVYVVEVVGATFTLLPLRLPGCQLYVDAPDAPSATLAPAQELPPPLTLIAGAEPTVTVVAAVAEQPFASVPVTV
jgi:hypothetical protein